MKSAPSFNLISDPWIPVMDKGGESHIVGLYDVFHDSSKFRDLACGPTQRVALMRLFVCIAQASIGVPTSAPSWRRVFGWGDLSGACRYLDKRTLYPRFNLFGPGPRFLQVDKLVAPTTVKVSKLFPHLATGNNHTLFDHEGGVPVRPFPARDIALGLLTFQCFHPVYGSGYPGQGPCSAFSMLHTLILGDNLGATICRNCITADWVRELFPKGGVGRPIWEDPDDATSSYLGRLVPRHRDLRLADDCAHFLLDRSGLHYPQFEDVREPAATVVTFQKRTKAKPTVVNRILPVKLERALWRDLHLLTVLRSMRGTPGSAPVALQIQAEVSDCDLRLWAGGQISDKAKTVDVVESWAQVPRAILNAKGHSSYQAGVEFADKAAMRLRARVSKYCRSLCGIRGYVEKAEAMFWHDLDQRSDVLLDVVCDPDTLAGAAFGNTLDPWTSLVLRTETETLRSVCERKTPRQIEAYAAAHSAMAA